MKTHLGTMALMRLLQVEQTGTLHVIHEAVKPDASAHPSEVLPRLLSPYIRLWLLCPKPPQERNKASAGLRRPDWGGRIEAG